MDLLLYYSGGLVGRPAAQSAGVSISADGEGYVIWYATVGANTHALTSDEQAADVLATALAR